jgi:eukaryotic-like serine/threonine-protein kinase
VIAPPGLPEAAQAPRSRRFEFVRHLGAGGMGTVFEAIDRQSGARVAVKTLRAPSPHALFYLKNEFRALQDVRHANWVNLLELIEENGQFFVAMELVSGMDFLAYVRAGQLAPLLSGMSETRRVSSEGALPGSSETVAREAAASGSFDEMRLREAFGQLAAALAALHASGKLHRDVKPSNILVTPTGRVVLVDFGLATELSAAGAASDSSGIGTRAFTAPEQYAGQQVKGSADWFSAGVLLYVALTGSLPFRGEAARGRAHGTFQSVRELCPSAPHDLCALC